MFNLHYMAHIEPQDGIGKSYDELVEMATSEYRVAPINTDGEGGSAAFDRWYFVTDCATSGHVHYSRRRQ